MYLCLLRGHCATDANFHNFHHQDFDTRFHFETMALAARIRLPVKKVRRTNKRASNLGCCANTRPNNPTHWPTRLFPRLNGTWVADLTMLVCTLALLGWASVTFFPEFIKNDYPFVVAGLVAALLELVRQAHFYIRFHFQILNGVPLDDFDFCRFIPDEAYTGSSCSHPPP